jgi:hypothetical protein
VESLADRFDGATDDVDGPLDGRRDAAGAVLGALDAASHGLDGAGQLSSGARTLLGSEADPDRGSEDQSVEHSAQVAHRLSPPDEWIGGGWVALPSQPPVDAPPKAMVGRSPAVGRRAMPGPAEASCGLSRRSWSLPIR